MAASNLKSVSFSLRFLLGNFQKWDEILEVWWMLQHIFISTRYGAKDLPSFKKCTALNIFFIYGCLVIGFGTSFFFIALVFPSHSISDLSHISFICYHHYIILAVDSIVQYNSSLSLPICPSIHPFISLIYLIYL